MTQGTPVLLVDQNGNFVTGGGSGSINTNIYQVGGAAFALGQQNSAGSLPVTIASDQSLAITGSVVASGSVALLAGAAVIGHVIVDAGSAVIGHVIVDAGTAVIGKVSIDQTTLGTTNAVQLIPGTTGGLSLSRTIIPNNTTAIVPKASAGQLYAISTFNNSTTIAYIKIYNATSATAGVGTPVDTIMIPAPPAGGGGGVVWSLPNGVAYGTGITYIVTTGIADNDTTAPAASTYIVTFYYK